LERIPQEADIAADSYRISLSVPARSLPIFETALEPLGGALVSGGPDGDGLAPLDVYVAGQPEEGEVGLLVRAGAAGAEIATPSFAIEKLPDIDWVAESQKALPSLQAGRFYIYGSHITDAPPPGRIPLLIEANVAFGTGQHETTRGCLLALSDLAKRIRPSSALDMGCGSGVLAMAIAKLWGCPVLAVDNDGPSIPVARENFRLNRVTAHARAQEGQGYRAATIGNVGPYDLIVANILAEPLVAMAKDLRSHLAPAGFAVLSGLLWHQAARVTARHRAAGLRLVTRYREGDWMTLVMQG